MIVVGGGFAGVAAAREAALRRRGALLLEARDRLGGRTWRADWHGMRLEYGAPEVHWHQRAGGGHRGLTRPTPVGHRRLIDKSIGRRR